MPRRHAHEDLLGDDALKDIARRYFSRRETNQEIAADHGIRRQAVPRVAEAGQRIIDRETSGPC